jgi:hypothetical protein
LLVSIISQVIFLSRRQFRRAAHTNIEMTKPRRGVKFNHRNGNGHGSSADGRRSSFSDISEAASEPNSEKHTGIGGDIKPDVSYGLGTLISLGYTQILTCETVAGGSCV